MSTVNRGGKSIYGASVGVLMLGTRFPRIPGDVGNAATWPFPVLFRIVRDASPDRVVRQGAPGLLDAFVEAGKELVGIGADGLTTSCGFLALQQEFVAIEHFGYDRFQGQVRAHHRLPVDPLGRELVGNLIAGTFTSQDFCPGEFVQDSLQTPVMVGVSVGDEDVGQLPA